ncbi:MFS domain-containing protein [Fusarium keratoplasticum]|uniref:MFS domain-containing protein n=1 Tax=Fusarium keratoplasticum TaxID=1328300 RepID=A0ACC0RBB6_9HYPO|nr:MFS domain-containing protein [Fusarium keratoplasticum]KAI8679342.1 MFS domain-containing protein [Fusarium keratoplasticum]
MPSLAPRSYQLLVGVFASLGAFLFGYDLGVIAAVVASDTFKSQFDPNTSEEGLVVSMFTAGAFFGAGAGGTLGDRIGRRGTIVVGAIVFLLGGGLQTGARNIHFLWTGRFISGLGVGVLCMIVPLYQAELAHPHIRGRITALQQLMIGVGAFIATWVGWACFVELGSSSAQWRVPLAIQNVPAIFLAALTYLFPESPRWLADKGKDEETLHTLARLHANGNVEDPFVMAEYDEIRNSIQYEHQHAAKSYKELFKSRSAFRRLFLCCAIQASVQMTGVSAIQYYSPTIFKQIGIATDDTLKYQGISNGLAIVAQACAMLLIDRTGRRWPLIGGNLFNSVTFIIASILLALFPPGTSSNLSAQWGFIVITWLYNFSFSSTCGPLSWIIPAEVFDTNTRAKGVSIATMASFAFNTMIGQVTPKAMESIGYRFYFLFVVCNVTNALFFWVFLPETARRPLEQMNEIFSSKSWVVIGKSTSYGGATNDVESHVDKTEVTHEAEKRQN